jgi:hypothetical protein
MEQAKADRSHCSAYRPTGQQQGGCSGDQQSCAGRKDREACVIASVSISPTQGRAGCRQCGERQAKQTEFNV